MLNYKILGAPVIAALINALLGILSTIIGVKYLGEQNFGALLAIISSANIIFAFAIGGISQLSIRNLYTNKSIIKYNNLYKLGLSQLIIANTASIALYLFGLLKIEVIIISTIFFVYRYLAVINRANSQFTKSILFEGATTPVTIILTATVVAHQDLTIITTIFIIILTLLTIAQLLSSLKIIYLPLSSGIEKNTISDYRDSVYLGSVFVVSTIQQNIDIIFLSNIVRSEEVTKYKLLMMMFLAFNLIHVVINKVYGPSIAKLIKANDIKEISRLWLVTVKAQFIFGSLTLMVGYVSIQPISNLFKIDFPLTQIGVFGVFIAGCSFALRSFLPIIMIQLGRNYELIKIYVLTLLITCVISPLLIMQLNYIGAILSFAIANTMISLLLLKEFQAIQGHN